MASSVNDGLKDGVISAVSHRCNHLPDSLALYESGSIALSFLDDQLFNIAEFKIRVKQAACRFRSGSEYDAEILVAQVYGGHAACHNGNDSKNQGEPSGKHGADR